MSKKCLYTVLISLSIFISILMIGVLVVFTHIDYFVHKQIREEAPLLNGSKIFSSWAHPANDTVFRYTFFLFNVTNPNDIREGQNPIVKDVGPYEFILKNEWNSINWNHNENELNYRMKRSFFRDHTCKGNLDDMITILNVPLVSFASLVKSKLDDVIIFKKFSELFLKNFLRKHDLFITHKAGDILFNGYADNFTKFVGPVIDKLRKLVDLDAPFEITMDGKFSLFGQKNNTDLGVWTIHTGKNNLTELGRLKMLDGHLNISCWTNNCASLHGTDALIHHPFIKNDDILPVFEPELNRTVFLNYERETEYMGIPTKRFVLSNNTYASPTVNTYNKCFFDENDEFNIYSGILKIKQCNKLVPLVISNPHFYLADEYFSEEVHGFSPDKEKHESFIDVTKDLGVVLRGRRTAQINMDTGPYSYFVYSKRKIFPVFWFFNSGNAGPSSVDKLNTLLYEKVKNIKKYLIIAASLLIAGFLVPLIYLVVDLSMYWNSQSDDTQQIINNTDNISNRTQLKNSDSQLQEK